LSPDLFSSSLSLSLNTGADVNGKGRDSDMNLSTPLGMAAEKLAGEELIELLIARGADPNLLSEASAGERLPLAKAIISTAQMSSLSRTALGTIKALLRHTRWGRQHCEQVFGAVFQTKHIELLKLLLDCDDELKVHHCTHAHFSSTCAHVLTCDVCV
jgi:hypothetical protein